MAKRLDIWRKRDGTLIRVSDMESSHIRNARNMMQRNMDKADTDKKLDWCMDWITAFNLELEARNEQVY